MVERSEQSILDYLLLSQQAEVVQRDGRETKNLKIGEKTYSFDKTKPTDRLKKKLKTVQQSLGYKKYELENKLGIRWTRLDKTRTKH